MRGRGWEEIVFECYLIKCSLGHGFGLQQYETIDSQCYVIKCSQGHGFGLQQ